MKEFIIVISFIVWFILAGVITTLLLNYLNITNSKLHIIFSLITAFIPMIIIYKKKNKKKEKISL